MKSKALEEWFVRVVIIQTWIFPCCPLVRDLLMIHSSPAFVCLKPYWDFSPRMANGLHFFLPPCTVVKHVALQKHQESPRLLLLSDCLPHAVLPNLPPLPVFDVF